MLRESGDLKAAVKEVARLSEMAESSRDRGLAARAELELALISEESGDLRKAKEHLARAGGILKEVGDRSGLVAVHIRTGMVDEKMGDEAGAASQYEEAVRQGELSGDKLGLASALENLGLVLGEEEERGSRALNRAAEVFLELGLVQHARRLRRSGS